MWRLRLSRTEPRPRRFLLFAQRALLLACMCEASLSAAVAAFNVRWASKLRRQLAVPPTALTLGLPPLILRILVFSETS